MFDVNYQGNSSYSYQYLLIRYNEGAKRNKKR